jgi:hypothetical protein
MNILPGSFKKYRTYNFYPKKISNINLLFNGEFVYLIYEKEFPLIETIKTYLEKKFIDPSKNYQIVVSSDIHNVKKIIDEYRLEKDIHYMGNLFVSDATLKNPRSILIFVKSVEIPRILYDPPITIKTIYHNNKKINVISDNLIIGGSKTRAILDYVRNLKPDITSLIYLGASNGYAQIAFAYSLWLLKSNIKLRIYFQYTQLDEAKKLQSIAKYIYPYVEYIILKKPFREIWPLIDAEIDKNPKTTFLIPFGLNDVTYKKYFHSSLEHHLQDQYISKIKILWIVGGSGTLFNTLYSILNETHFNVVQVGKEIHLTEEQKKRITIYKSSYSLYAPINMNIPYPTLKSYDGKIWEFSDKFSDDMYIWNVGGVHAII